MTSPDAGKLKDISSRGREEPDWPRELNKAGCSKTTTANEKKADTAPSRVRRPQTCMNIISLVEYANNSNRRPLVARYRP